MANIRTKHVSLPAIQVLLLVAPFLLHVGLAQNCATTGCQTGYCCSKYGYCGTTDDYCGANCASQCPSPPSSPSPPTSGPPSGSGVGSIVTSSVFDNIFPPSTRNSFYTYDSFISATGSFASFGTTGSSDAQKQEIAAFFAHVYHETSGLSKINEDTSDPNHYCEPSNTQYPCASGQQYFGRGPLQISWNYNYGPAGDAIGEDLLDNPGLVSQDPVISFKTALWFWTTAQSPKPSCHDVMDGTWQPSSDDTAAGRTPGFGETIDIINGGIECGPSAQNAPAAQDRVTQYQTISSKLNVDPGSNLDCTNMQPYAS